MEEASHVSLALFVGQMFFVYALATTLRYARAVLFVLSTVHERHPFELRKSHRAFVDASIQSSGF